MSPLHQVPALTWRQAMSSDLAAIGDMADRVHTDLPERPEVFAEKMQLFPEGCFVLVSGRNIAGYALSHPWRVGAFRHSTTFWAGYRTTATASSFMTSSCCPRFVAAVQRLL